jgi:hypothetical protein
VSVDSIYTASGENKGKFSLLVGYPAFLVYSGSSSDLITRTKA